MPPGPSALMRYNAELMDDYNQDRFDEYVDWIKNSGDGFYENVEWALKRGIVAAQILQRRVCAA